MKRSEDLLREELEALQHTQVVLLKSALMAGILLIPEGLTLWNSDTDEEPGLDEELIDGLVNQAQADVETCSTYVPMILRGDPELIREVRHVKFGDAELLAIIQDRIEVVESRLGMLESYGMDK